MSALRKNTISNFAYVKNVEVEDNTGASKTVSTVSEIDFGLTDLTVQDARPVPVTSSTPMRNKGKPAIDIDETKNSDTLKELYKYIPRKFKMYAVKGTKHWRKLKNLKKITFLMKIKKRTMLNSNILQE